MALFYRSTSINSLSDQDEIIVQIQQLFERHNFEVNSIENGISFKKNRGGNSSLIPNRREILAPPLDGKLIIKRKDISKYKIAWKLKIHRLIIFYFLLLLFISIPLYLTWSWSTFFLYIMIPIKVILGFLISLGIVAYKTKEWEYLIKQLI